MSDDTAENDNSIDDGRVIRSNDGRVKNDVNNSWEQDEARKRERVK